MKIRSSPIIVTLLIASLILAACSPADVTPTPGSPAPGDTPTDTTDATPADTAGECPAVQLDYWNPFTGPDGPFMGQLVDAFNSENPDITVTMSSQAD